MKNTICIRCVIEAGAFVAAKHALLEDLKYDNPDFLLGLLRAPATDVGTRIERAIADSLAQLHSHAKARSAKFLCLGPSSKIIWDQPGIRTLLVNACGDKRYLQLRSNCAKFLSPTRVRH